MRNMKKNTANTGFTLIEMLVVIMIIGILIGVSAYGFNKLRENAHNTRATMMAKQMAEAWNLYILENGWFPHHQLENCKDPENEGWYVTDKNFVKYVRDSEPKFYFDLSREHDDKGLLDPWKEKHYRFWLDEICANNNCNNHGGMTSAPPHPDGATKITSLVLVWSYGRNKVKGTFPDTDSGLKPADDIIVW